MNIAREICTDSFYTVNNGLPCVPVTAVFHYWSKDEQNNSIGRDCSLHRGRTGLEGCWPSGGFRLGESLSRSSSVYLEGPPPTILFSSWFIFSCSIYLCTQIYIGNIQGKLDVFAPFQNWNWFVFMYSLSAQCTGLVSKLTMKVFLNINLYHRRTQVHIGGRGGGFPSAQVHLEWGESRPGSKHPDRSSSMVEVSLKKKVRKVAMAWMQFD